MNYNIFLQKFEQGNRIRNFPLNERYLKKNITLTKDSNRTNINSIYNKTIPSKNSKSISISEAIKKIENLKKKYNKINFEKQINSKIVYKKILRLKNKYFSENNKNNNNNNNKIINTENNTNNNNKFQIESTDKITMINKSWNKKQSLDLLLQSNNDSDRYYNTYRNDKKIRLQKSNEIYYQINSGTPQNSKRDKNRVNINSLKNYSENNNKNMRDEFLYLDKKINLLLKEDDNNDDNDEDEFLYKKRRLKSVCPIKDRIILLTDVKNKIKKINKDYEDNEKTQNSEFSIDSEINLGFKHIRPIIKKENFLNEYFKDDEPKKENETISKPMLIRSLPRPKLNVPNYPSFFLK